MTDPLVSPALIKIVRVLEENVEQVALARVGNSICQNPPRLRVRACRLEVERQVWAAWAAG